MINLEVKQVHGAVNILNIKYIYKTNRRLLYYTDGCKQILSVLQIAAILKSMVNSYITYFHDIANIEC